MDYKVGELVKLDCASYGFYPTQRALDEILCEESQRKRGFPNERIIDREQMSEHHLEIEDKQYGLVLSDKTILVFMSIKLCPFLLVLVKEGILLVHEDFCKHHDK